MTERPVIFSSPMVRAILEGRKTQTRRVLRPQITCFAGAVPSFSWGRFAGLYPDDWFGYGNEIDGALPVAVGDRLWVRETFHVCKGAQRWKDGTVLYRADHGHTHGGSYIDCAVWKSSIHMPRSVSRITLEVTAVKVERLQEISEADAKAEGAAWHDGGGIGHSGWRHDLSDVHDNARSSFARLWTSIHGPGAWEANPWVTAVSFKRVKG